MTLTLRRPWAEKVTHEDSLIILWQTWTSYATRIWLERTDYFKCMFSPNPNLSQLSNYKGVAFVPESHNELLLCPALLVTSWSRHHHHTWQCLQVSGHTLVTGHISHCNFCNALVTGEAHTLLTVKVWPSLLSPLSVTVTVIVPLITRPGWTLQTVQTTPHTRVACCRLRENRGKVKCFISYDIPFCHGFQTSTSTLPGELKLGAQIHDSHMY